MNKKRSTNQPLLIGSLILNAALLVLVGLTVVFARVADDSLDVAKFNALQERMCGEKYEEYMQKWDDAQGENGRKVFAATVCLRDYRTGNDLDIDSLFEE